MMYLAETTLIEVGRNPLKSGLLSYLSFAPVIFCDRRLSQSPQIGAAVLPPSWKATTDCTGPRRNPLKSGLLSYHNSVPWSFGTRVCRNPLKSGLLSYRGRPGRPRLVIQRVAIPSNRGCCPTLKYVRRPNGMANSRNPLKSGLLSYQHTFVATVLFHGPCRNPLKSGLLSYLYHFNGEPGFAVESQSPQIGAAVLPSEWDGEHFENLCVAIPSNRGCCPTVIFCDRRFPCTKGSQSPQIGAAVLPHYVPWSFGTRARSQSPQIGAAVLPNV